MVGDTLLDTLLVVETHYLSETPTCSVVGDALLVIGDTLRVVGDTLLVIGDTLLVVGDTQLVVL